MSDTDGLCARCGKDGYEHLENPECEWCGMSGLDHELAEDRAGVYRECRDGGYYEPLEDSRYQCPDKRGWWEKADRYVLGMQR